MKDLMESLSYLHPEGYALVEKAYEYASWAHSYQIRDSGAPYLTHLVAAAKNLSEIKVDAQTVAAALLHDILEDTLVVEKELTEEFGAEVVSLVKGVTKLNKYQFDDSITEQAENWKKMLLAVVEDARVILIKIADRLHNMRTIQFLPLQKQQSVSMETLTLYAPFAHRLGIYKWRNELEDLSFQVLYPAEYTDIKEKLEARVENNTENLREVEMLIKEKLDETKIPYKILSRPKNLYGIYKKMERQQKSFEEIEDIFGLRVITDNVENCYVILGIINTNFNLLQNSFTDYINIPKQNGYQSLHLTIISKKKAVIETQIRTDAMNQGAEYGIAAHWRYKIQAAGGSASKNKSGNNAEMNLDWLKHFLEEQISSSDSKEFINSLRMECNFGRIFVFTPKNKVISLPLGATTLDFAYAIHSDIGDTFLGAKVNGKMAGINVKLKTGDVCDVLTRKNIHPTLNWLEYATSDQAKGRIRKYLREHNLLPQKSTNKPS